MPLCIPYIDDEIRLVRQSRVSPADLRRLAGDLGIGSNVPWEVDMRDHAFTDPSPVARVDRDSVDTPNLGRRICDDERLLHLRRYNRMLRAWADKILLDAGEADLIAWSTGTIADSFLVLGLSRADARRIIRREHKRSEIDDLPARCKAMRGKRWSKTTRDRDSRWFTPHNFRRTPRAK
jgi:hypothetical protein